MKDSARLGRLFCDGQGFEGQADRSVTVMDHRPVERDVGDDLAGHPPFGIGQAGGQSFGHFGGTWRRETKTNLMSFADKRK